MIDDEINRTGVGERRSRDSPARTWQHFSYRRPFVSKRARASFGQIGTVEADSNGQHCNLAEGELTLFGNRKQAAPFEAFTQEVQHSRGWDRWMDEGEANYCNCFLIAYPRLIRSIPARLTRQHLSLANVSRDATDEHQEGAFVDPLCRVLTRARLVARVESTSLATVHNRPQPRTCKISALDHRSPYARTRCSVFAASLYLALLWSENPRRSLFVVLWSPRSPSADDESFFFAPTILNLDHESDGHARETVKNLLCLSIGVSLILSRTHRGG